MNKGSINSKKGPVAQLKKKKAFKTQNATNQQDNVAKDRYKEASIVTKPKTSESIIVNSPLYGFLSPNYCLMSLTMFMSSQEMVGLFGLQNARAKWEKWRLRSKAYKNEVLLDKLGVCIDEALSSIFSDP